MWPRKTKTVEVEKIVYRDKKPEPPAYRCGNCRWMSRGTLENGWMADCSLEVTNVDRHAFPISETEACVRWTSINGKFKSQCDCGNGGNK